MERLYIFPFLFMFQYVAPIIIDLVLEDKPIVHNLLIDIEHTESVLYMLRDLQATYRLSDQATNRVEQTIRTQLSQQQNQIFKLGDKKIQVPINLKIIIGSKTLMQNFTLSVNSKTNIQEVAELIVQDHAIATTAYEYLQWCNSVIFTLIIQIRKYLFTQKSANVSRAQQGPVFGVLQDEEQHGK